MSSSIGSSSRSSKRKSRSVCYCGFAAARRISNSEKNPGRAYFNCPNFPKPDSCSFFCWDSTVIVERDDLCDEDELIRARRNEELLHTVIMDLRKEREEMLLEVTQLRMLKLMYERAFFVSVFFLCVTLYFAQL